MKKDGVVLLSLLAVLQLGRVAGGPLAFGLGTAASAQLGGMLSRSAHGWTAPSRWKCSSRYEDDEMKSTAQRGSKNLLWAPATSLISWREYRARLIKGETPFYLRRASQEKGIWVHELAQLERGCLLIESPAHGNQEKWSSVKQGGHVVLLIKHSEQGSLGLILNKPMPCAIGDLTNKMPDFAENRIYFGGDGKKKRDGQRARGEAELHTVHSVKGLKGGEELTDGVFTGADVVQAQRVVSLNLAKPQEFKFFYSSSWWEAGELDKEIAEGRWIAAAASKDVVLKPSSHWELNFQKPLWRILLEILGGKHGLMAREVCGDF